MVRRSLIVVLILLFLVGSGASVALGGPPGYESAPGLDGEGPLGRGRTPEAAGIYAGAAKVVITPDTDFVSATGVNDDLYARCVAINWKDTYAILVSLDLLGVNLEDIVIPVRDRVEEAYGIDGDYVLVGSSHTHSSGVDVIGVYSGSTNPYIVNQYKPQLIEKVVDVIGVALDDMKKASVHVGSIQVDGLTFNRRYYPDEGPTDDELTVLRFADSEDQTVATFVNFASHTVITMTGTLVSADYVGYLCKQLENEFGGVGIFFNGALGNINPHMFIKYSSPYAPGDLEMYQAAEEYGHTLAEYAIQALESGNTFRNLPLEVAKVEVHLPVENPGFLYLISMGLMQRELIPYDDGYALQAEVSGLKMGPIMMLSVPGELFSEISLSLKEQMPRYGMVLGLTTELLGYIIPPDQWAPGTGEVGESTSLGVRTAPILVEALEQVIKALD